MPPVVAMKGLLFAWAISWGIAALWSNRTEARPNLSAELLYRVVTVVGVALLLGLGRRLALHYIMHWKAPEALSWALVGVAAAGFMFCWWARIHLGRLWSSSVTRKADHRIVDTGPYALVRHPIYTGIITASAAMAIQDISPATLVGFGLIVLGFWLKARLEERFLRAELGAEAYDAYSRRTPMLFPGL
jgi:protein-S-isoprenylcysteine O-methyltransferase Ste14